MNFRKISPNRGSHLPVLMRLIQATTGPVVELGCGMYSTPYLHWACYPGRRLTTYESDPQWFERFLARFKSDWHDVANVADWDAVEFPSEVSVALVDHAPDDHRRFEVAKLRHADLVVCHDAENANARKYRYHLVYPLFKYRAKFSGSAPYTLVLSDKHDVQEMLEDLCR